MNKVDRELNSLLIAIERMKKDHNSIEIVITQLKNDKIIVNGTYPEGSM